MSVSPAEICTAAPSRPTDAPKSCEPTVKMKINGTMRRGVQVRGSWTSSMIIELPAADRPPT